MYPGHHGHSIQYSVYLDPIIIPLDYLQKPSKAYLEPY